MILYGVATRCGGYSEVRCVVGDGDLRAENGGRATGRTKRTKQQAARRGLNDDTEIRREIATTAQTTKIGQGKHWVHMKRHTHREGWGETALHDDTESRPPTEHHSRAPQHSTTAPSTRRGHLEPTKPNSD